MAPICNARLIVQVKFQDVCLQRSGPDSAQYQYVERPASSVISTLQAVPSCSPLSRPLSLSSPSL